MIVIKDISLTLLEFFLIAACGFLLGGITIKGARLGTASLFLVGLAFGHFGISLPEIIQTLGLVLFIATVGMEAGPGFASNVRRNGPVCLLLCMIIALTGAAICLTVIRLVGLETEMAVGLMTGAFTSSPGFAAAREAVGMRGQHAMEQVAAGYGVAYSIGMTGKVAYLQLLPGLLHLDMEKERKRILCPPGPGENGAQHQRAEYRRIDPVGLFSLSLACIGGILLGSVTLRLPGGGEISLGMAGGPLITGLLLGHLRHLGPIDLHMDRASAKALREIGLMMFFAGAGSQCGGFVKAVLTSGPQLLLVSLLILLVPLLAGTFAGLRILKLPFLNGMAAIAASMTCTPSLVLLMEMAGSDEPGTVYAAVYPFALIIQVCMVQLLLSV